MLRVISSIKEFVFCSFSHVRKSLLCSWESFNQKLLRTYPSSFFLATNLRLRFLESALTVSKSCEFLIFVSTISACFSNSLVLIPKQSFLNCWESAPKLLILFFGLLSDAIGDWRQRNHFFYLLFTSMLALT